MATYLKWRGLLFAALTEVGGGAHLRDQNSTDILVMIMFFSWSHVTHEDIITGDSNDNKIMMKMMKMTTGCTGLQTWRGTLRHSVRGTWVEIFIKHPSPLLTSPSLRLFTWSQISRGMSRHFCRSTWSHTCQHILHCDHWNNMRPEQFLLFDDFFFIVIMMMEMMMIRKAVIVIMMMMILTMVTCLGTFSQTSLGTWLHTLRGTSLQT